MLRDLKCAKATAITGGLIGALLTILPLTAALPHPSEGVFKVTTAVVMTLATTVVCAAFAALFASPVGLVFDAAESAYLVAEDTLTTWLSPAEPEAGMLSSPDETEEGRLSEAEEP